MKKYYGDGSIIKTYQTQDEADQDLAAGRLDYVQEDAITLGTFLRTDVGQACCELKGTVRDDPEILGRGAGGGLRKEDTELKVRINAALKTVR